MSTETQLEQGIVLTATIGDNGDLFLNILSLYVPEGSVVADVTFGKGVFWKNVDTSKYVLKASDLMDGIDFRSLPYEDGSIDALVLDPPYMHDGKSVHKSLQTSYQNHTVQGGHASVMRLYAGGIIEAARVLRKNGILIVKCQDEIESGKQRWSHVELIHLLEMFGFEVIDLFVLLQDHDPILQHKGQQHARKNHSFAIVARFRC
jgi:tRNA G10  N-methylase Trm11